MISYEKLVKKLKDNNISQYKLKQEKILGYVGAKKKTYELYAL